MTPDDARPALEPTASLTSVRIKRRRMPAAAAGKPGDLTAGDEPPPEPTSAAPSAAEPEAPAALLLPPPEPDPPPADPAPEPEADAAGDLDILDYWDSLRGARDVPALDELDCAHVAATWRNTLLLAVEETELPRITRLGETDGEVEYTAMVVDWIMARGRHSARHAKPMEEEQRFAASSGGARYRLLLLPVGGDGLKSDHVLCQLSRVEERGAVASLRRWLGG